MVIDSKPVGPSAIHETMGGQTKAVFETLGPILGIVQGGKLRVLASTSDRVERGLENTACDQRGLL